jgi:hypothetical protein
VLAAVIYNKIATAEGKNCKWKKLQKEKLKKEGLAEETLRKSVPVFHYL